MNKLSLRCGDAWKSTLKSPLLAVSTGAFSLPFDHHLALAKPARNKESGQGLEGSKLSRSF